MSAPERHTAIVEGCLFTFTSAGERDSFLELWHDDDVLEACVFQSELAEAGASEYDLYAATLAELDG